VLYKGEWRLHQDVAALEQKEQSELAAKEWRRKIVQWRGWLGGRRDSEARERLLGISDPMAIWGLGQCLLGEEDGAIRELYVDILGRFEGPEAAAILIHAAIDDPDEEVRLRSTSLLKGPAIRRAVAEFSQALYGSDNRRINRAGAALGQLGDPDAVLPLIDALVTRHDSIVRPTSGIRPSFGSGPNGSGFNGLSVGDAPKRVTQYLENRSVLEALVKITGQNFRYDEVAWKEWYRSRHALPDSINLRRDP
jgi:hypothetical protein